LGDYNPVIIGKRKEALRLQSSEILTCGFRGRKGMVKSSAPSSDVRRLVI
jgi:hypothetical protein